MYSIAGGGSAGVYHRIEFHSFLRAHNFVAARRTLLQLLEQMRAFLLQMPNVAGGLECDRGGSDVKHIRRAMLHGVGQVMIFGCGQIVVVYVGDGREDSSNGAFLAVPSHR